MAKRGPKSPPNESPLPGLDDLPPAGGARVAAFCERYLVVPRGHGAGAPLRLRPWQREIVDGLFDEPRPWTGLLSLPRGQGKSTLAAVLALYELHAGSDSPEVLVVATDERQAGIVLGQARRITERSPELLARTGVYADHLRVPGRSGTMHALPSEPAAVEGWDPSFVVVDELGAGVREATWESLVGYAGKRPSSLTLAISTPAGTEDSVMWRIVSERRANPDPLHYLREYAAPDGCALDDEEAWAVAMPALDDFMSREAVRSKLTTMREAAFRRYVLGQWVSGAEAWLPFGAWANVAEPDRVVEPGTRLALGFDGSASGDSTALIGCTIETTPHLFLVGLWENPNDRGWRVPRALVDETVARAMGTYDVATLSCDPWGWRSEIEAWAARWPGQVEEWPTNIAARMGPGTDRLYAAVMEHQVSQDGSPDFQRHVNNAQARSTPVGDLVQKPSKSSPAKIDALVAGIVAHDRAVWHRDNAAPRRRAVAFFG